MNKFLFSLSLSLVVCVSLSSLSFAQLSLSKREIKIEVKSGQNLKGSIILENSSNENLTLKTYFEDFTLIPPYNGTMNFLPLGSTSVSCGKWFSIIPDSFIIPAKKKQEITYSIKVPNTVKGGYYGVLWFERSSATSAEKGVSLVIREGCKFFLETQDIHKKAGIVDIVAEKDSIKGNLLNSGDGMLISQGTFYIIDANNIISDRGTMQKFYLPAGEKASFGVKVSNNVLQGRNTLFINLDFGENKLLVKEIDFTKDSTGNVKIDKIKD